jgi:hypothetical protein
MRERELAYDKLAGIVSTVTAHMMRFFRRLAVGTGIDTGSL